MKYSVLLPVTGICHNILAERIPAHSLDIVFVVLQDYKLLTCKSYLHGKVQHCVVPEKYPYPDLKGVSKAKILKDVQTKNPP